MARKILVPIDGSEPSWDALEFALEHHSDADIIAYHVVSVVSAIDDTLMGTAPKYEEELYEAQEQEAESLLADAEALASEYGIDIETEYERGFPREAILNYAENHDIDQIIIGSHGRSGLSRVVIGSVAEKVSRHAPVPVTIVRPDVDTS